MRIVHLYPFEPHGLNGGTLRLRAALEASEAVANTDLWFYDSAAGQWRGPLGPNQLLATSERHEAARSKLNGAKRTLFPSTLLECGSSAVRRAGQDVDLRGARFVILHTSYLSPLARFLVHRGVSVAVDVYDLVWRSHFIDSILGPLGKRAIRRAYARAARLREEANLRRAQGLLVAGWEDWEHASAASTTCLWVPTPVVTTRGGEHGSPPTGTLRVGLLGNFAHLPTRDSADALVTSPLARSSNVRVVLAGAGSDRAALPPGASVVRLGPVGALEDFYEQVDCVVACGESGAGMKVKLAEGVLAGKPVITSQGAAAGFPPALRDHLAVVANPRELDEGFCRAAVARHRPEEAARTFAAHFAWDVGVRRYERALRAIFDVG
jgi:Glycosyl transferases group 1